MRKILYGFAMYVFAFASLTQAQPYPAKTVRVIIPWPTGGLTDIAGRMYFQKMSQTLGQQFVIDNRPGASGVIGADIVAKLPPDGYTLMVHSTMHVANPHLMTKMPSLMSGETQLFISTPAAVMAQLQAGLVRALGVTADTRLARLPTIPTIVESGVPGYEMNSWVGMMAPAGLPRNIADFVNTKIKKAMDAPDMKSRLEVLDPWHMPPEQITARVKAE